MIVLTFVLLLSLSLLFISSLIGYIFILLIYVCILIIWLAFSSIIPEIISLMILLVYVGAISVLFIYVSAVSPNNSIPRSFSIYNSLVVVVVYIIFYLLDVGSFSFTFGGLNLLDEMFSGAGVILTLGIVLVLILVLAAVTFISPSSSTFRSFSA